MSILEKQSIISYKRQPNWRIEWLIYGLISTSLIVLGNFIGIVSIGDSNGVVRDIFTGLGIGIGAAVLAMMIKGLIELLIFGPAYKRHLD